MRPFYIMYHNPNRVGNVEDSETVLYGLTHGANALAPDILFYENKFRVMHDITVSIDNAPLLENYLAQLTGLLQNNSALNLQLIAFDLKDTDGTPYDFKDMQKIIQDNFSSKVPGVGIIFSTPDNFDFLVKEVVPHLTSSQAAGTDEFNDPEQAHIHFKEGSYNYIYGFGNSTFFHDLTEPISKAVSMRDKGNSFKMVYPWTIDTKASLKHYLDLEVDGMITNEPERLRNLIEDEYQGKYRLNGTFAGF